MVLDTQHQNDMLALASVNRDGVPCDMSKLRRFREQRGLSQGRLAELANTSQTQIMRLETGQRELDIEWAKRLAKPLGVAAFQLIEDEDFLSEEQRRFLLAIRAMDDRARRVLDAIIEGVEADQPQQD